MAERVIPLHPAGRAIVPRVTGAAASNGDVADRLGRRLHDLRISVTDRCNFRCTYCMPKEVFDKAHAFLPHSELLTFEEIVRLARVFIDHGVEKIRLTGGEPLLRKNIETLVEMLAKLSTRDGKALDLTLTTNGSLLARKAQALRDAGLRRVTVSLDALDDAVFRSMNDVEFPVRDVLAGIEAAAAAGLAPVKVNMVVQNGINDHEIVPMARRFKGSGHILRFIEFMDVGATNGWRMESVLPSADVIRRIDAELPLESIESQYAGEVAERWRYRDGSGEIGVISSVTQAFCRDCTRARLSTDGKLYLCLFAAQGYDLRALLREQAASDEQLHVAVANVWRNRGDRYSELRSEATVGLRRVEMSYIGG